MVTSTSVRSFLLQMISNLTISVPMISLQLQPVDGLNLRGRVLATCLIIQTFLRGCLCFNRKANGMPLPQVVGRSTSSNAHRGPSPTSLVMASICQLLALLYATSYAVSLHVLFVTLVLSKGEPCPYPKSPSPLRCTSSQQIEVCLATFRACWRHPFLYRRARES